MDYMGSSPKTVHAKKANEQNGGNMMNKTVLIALVAIMMIASPAFGAVITEDVEIRGEVATGDITYDYTNFGAFWYDLKKNHSSEVMTVDVTGTRNIIEGDLVYTCTPRSVTYKNSDLNDKYGGYVIMGFMAEKYICYDNKTERRLMPAWYSAEIRTHTKTMKMSCCFRAR